MCLACHQQPDMLHTLPSGDVLNVTVDPEAFQLGAHSDIQCVDCHTDIRTYPHPERPEVQDERDYSLFYRNVCQDCHEAQYDEVLDSVHGDALAAGNRNAPVCADCHEPHYQPMLTTETGAVDPGHGAMIALTCAQCHSTIYEEYSHSVHGEGVIGDRNPDTPSCNDCHGVHSIESPTEARFRLQSPQMCASCHTDPEVMGRYGLSTYVLNTYVADFHGTTVTLFQRTHPDQPLNQPVCYDCHGVHNIVAVDDPQRGVQIKENMLLACQQCHPDASENFPASWLSHYIPDRQNYPLVYYVQLFYNIFIPTVLGSMAIFVVSDILRRARVTRKGPQAPGPGTK
jgi:predicted CXXCH cytochrome family protein